LRAVDCLALGTLYARCVVGIYVIGLNQSQKMSLMDLQLFATSQSVGQSKPQNLASRSSAGRPSTRVRRESRKEITVQARTAQSSVMSAHDERHNCKLGGVLLACRIIVAEIAIDGLIMQRRILTFRDNLAIATAEEADLK
jgi:hypothetical protein